MARSLRFGRVGAAFAVFALVLTSLVAPSSSFAAPRLVKSGQSTAKRGDIALASRVLRSIGPVTANRGLPPIELNVDSTTEDANASLVTYTSNTTMTPFKWNFCNRFTLSADQAPFKLSVVAVLLGQLEDGSGFEAGETIGLFVLADPSSSGSIANALPLFVGTAEVPGPGFAAFQLPEDLVFRQGDIYIGCSDITTDAEGTPLPVVQPENGGSTDPRGFVSGASTPTPVPDPTATGRYFASNTLPLGDGDLIGNFAIRGFGDNAAATDLVSGGGQPVNTDLDPPQNLSALGSSMVTLSYEAAPIPAFNEVEPNNSAGGAQMVPFNQVINATVKTSDPGTDVGGGNFEDWFSFTLTESSPITVDVVDDGGTDIDIFLYAVSDTGTAIAQSAGDCGAHELIDGVELAAGTYVVAIDAFANPNCEATSNTPYSILIVGPGGVRLTAFNVYSGSSEGFEANAASFIGAVSGSTLGLIVQESAIGAFYKVSAVYGDEQSAATDAVTGTPCEGGPTFSSVKVKRNGAGKITMKGGVGSLAGIQLQINGVGFASAPKVKGTKVTQKGPLANGQTVGQACPAGCTITILTSAGCSTVVGQ